MGQIAWLLNMAFVDRGNTEQARAALAPVVERISEGYSLAISPEGTRSPTPRVGHFKKGAFHMALQAGVPIVPIVIRNAGQLLWRGSTVHAPGHGRRQGPAADRRSPTGTSRTSTTTSRTCASSSSARSAEWPTP